MSIEGDALRAAAEDLARYYPALSRVVTARLRHLAAAHDSRVVVRAARQEAARQRELAALDTRGRWVRRTRGNGGPGIPGVGHITGTTRYPLDEATAMCGARLRGRLDWGPSSALRADAGWRVCTRCACATAEASAA